MGRLATFSALVSISLLACGEDRITTPPALDSGVVPDARPDADASLVSPVAAPAPVHLACPPGWRTEAIPGVAGATVCNPFPETGPEDCAAHEAHFVGEAGCTRVGSVCAADGWPEVPTDGVVIYVDAEAAPGGDGSRALPYASLNDAVSAAPPGATLAIAVGDYADPMRINVGHPLTFRGACAEGVSIDRGGDGGLAIIQVDGVRDGTVTFEDLTFRTTNDDRVVGLNSNLAFDSVVLDGATLFQSGGTLAAESVSGRGSTDTSAAFFTTTQVTDVTVARFSARDSEASGFSLSAATAVELRDVAITDAGRVGVLVSSDEIRLTRAYVESTAESGISLDGHAVVSDVVALGGERALGDSLGLYLEGSGEISRARVEGWGGATLGVSRGDVALEDIVAGAGGNGLEVGSGARATLRGAVISDARGVGIFVATTGSSLIAEDVIVDSVGITSDGNFGRCLHAQTAGTVTIDRVRLSRCREAGVTASYAASVTLRDVVIEDVLPIACSAGGCAAGVGVVALEEGGSINLERFVIDGAALAGVQVVPGGEVDLRDGTIIDNPVGVNIQVEGYDITRLNDRVVFMDNALNLDSTALPVPAAVTR